MPIMRSLTSLLALASLAVTAGPGCTREQKLPPGDWQGRCATRDQSGAEAEVRASDGLKGAPELSSPVIDQAAVLDPLVEAQMARELEVFHAETCHQLAVVTVKSLNGHSVDKYSLALSHRLGLGYRGFNNGILLLLAPNERMARIEVGCGLEDVISDEAASEIMRDSLMPAFRKGDFAAGARAGMHALMKGARMKQIPSDHRPAGCPAKPR
jgi:uncharacterized protein